MHFLASEGKAAEGKVRKKLCSVGVKVMQIASFVRYKSI